MLSTEVVIAGGGISGLLIASALAPHCSVVLLEQADQIPKNKFWLTNESVVDENSKFHSCINRRYGFLDFVAYDGSNARIQGRYCLWDTVKLINHLVDELQRSGVLLLTGHRLYSVSATPRDVVVKANSETIHARLLLDCMGFGSPLVGAKNIATITGYYIVHGREVGINSDVPPIALDNVIIDRSPAYFELFPTSQETAHAALILPARHHKPDISLSRELSFVLEKSHYSKSIRTDATFRSTPYFGIVPVGRLRVSALDRMLFFGEAGQTNPAASATGFTRMLRTYKGAAAGVVSCLHRDTLDHRTLSSAMPPAMTRMNRAFQETLFESLLSFTSDDFRRLVEDLRDYPDSLVNDLLFAEFEFGGSKTLRLATDALLRPRGVLGRHVVKSLRRYCRLG